MQALYYEQYEEEDEEEADSWLSLVARGQQVGLELQRSSHVVLDIDESEQTMRMLEVRARVGGHPSVPQKAPSFLSWCSWNRRDDVSGLV